MLDAVHMRYSTILALFVCSFSAAQGAGKLDPELKDLSSDQAVDVIVQFKSAPTEAQHRRVLAHGGQLKETLDIIRAAHCAVPANHLEALSAEPDVEFIAPDRKVKATGNASGANEYTGSPDYGWETVGANLATSVSGLNGTGIGIALLDSGTNANSDLTDLQGRSRKGRSIHWSGPKSSSESNSLIP
jgi:hypothetical protein